MSYKHTMCWKKPGNWSLKSVLWKMWMLWSLVRRRKKEETAKCVITRSSHRSSCRWDESGHTPYPALHKQELVFRRWSQWPKRRSPSPHEKNITARGGIPRMPLKRVPRAGHRSHCKSPGHHCSHSGPTCSLLEGLRKATRSTREGMRNGLSVVLVPMVSCGWGDTYVKGLLASIRIF